MTKKLSFLLIVLLFIWGCKADKITVPAYIQVDNYFTKVASSGNEGTNNQKFTDVLVYANGQACGTYPIGSPIPVLASGPTKLLIRGVVEINGVSALRSDYEVMQGCDTIITVTPGEVKKVRPVFEYYPTTYFAYMETFDTAPDSGNKGTPLANVDTNDDTTAFTTPSATHTTLGFLGSKCLGLSPNSTHVITEVQTTSAYYLPNAGVGVYMEFNYLSNIPINVRIEGKASGTVLEVGGVYQSLTWNKIYLDLTEEVSNMHDSSGEYIIFIYCTYDASVGTNLALIDNIKVLAKQ